MTLHTLFNSTGRSKPHSQQRQHFYEVLDKDLGTITDWAQIGLFLSTPPKHKIFFILGLKEIPPLAEMLSKLDVMSN